MMAEIRTYQLLNMERQPVRQHISLEFGEVENDHYIKVLDGDAMDHRNYVEWTSNVALTKIRKELEQNSLLIAIAGSLIYARFSRMCLEHGGYHGYNYKEFDGESIPASIFAFDEVEPSEYPYIATLEQQRDYDFRDENRFRLLSI